MAAAQKTIQWHRDKGQQSLDVGQNKYWCLRKSAVRLKWLHSSTRKPFIVTFWRLSRSWPLLSAIHLKSAQKNATAHQCVGSFSSTSNDNTFYFFSVSVDTTASVTTNQHLMRKSSRNCANFDVNSRFELIHSMSSNQMFIFCVTHKLAPV